MNISEFISQNQESLDILIVTITLSYLCFTMDKIVNWYHQHSSTSYQYKMAQSELQMFVLQMSGFIINRNQNIQECLDRNIPPPDILVRKTIEWLQFRTENDIRHAMKPD